jgi:hypothetical protein
MPTITRAQRIIYLIEMRRLLLQLHLDLAAFILTS